MRVRVYTYSIYVCRMIYVVNFVCLKYVDIYNANNCFSYAIIRGGNGFSGQDIHFTSIQKAIGVANTSKENYYIVVLLIYSNAYFY
jgi:hypothetical protein